MKLFVFYVVAKVKITITYLYTINLIEALEQIIESIGDRVGVERSCERQLCIIAKPME